MKSVSVVARPAQFALVAAVAVLGYRLHTSTRPYESNDIADVTWKEGGEPMTVVVSVHDAAGHVVSEALVSVHNNSGTNSATTDANGIATLEMGESDFSALDINNGRVVDRPHAYRLGSPTVANGLSIDVLLKNASHDR